MFWQLRNCCYGSDIFLLLLSKHASRNVNRSTCPTEPALSASGGSANKVGPEWTVRVQRWRRKGSPVLWHRDVDWHGSYNVREGVWLSRNEWLSLQVESKSSRMCLMVGMHRLTGSLVWFIGQWHFKNSIYKEACREWHKEGHREYRWEGFEGSVRLFASWGSEKSHVKIAGIEQWAWPYNIYIIYMCTYTNASNEAYHDSF